LKHYIKNTADLLPDNLSKNELKLRNIGIETLNLAIHAVKPKNLMRRSLQFEDDTLITEEEKFKFIDYKKILIIGGGKAAADMLEIIEKLLIQASYINYEGIINVPEGLELDVSRISEKVSINYASHPIPDENGLIGTKKMMDLIQKATKDDLIICLISGGGSALLPLPKNGITLKDLSVMNSLLLTSGASIDEINTIRKHVSDFKGGNLAKVIYNKSKAKLLTLIISDVVGDDYSIIASGPTVPDDTTFSNAMEIVKCYSLEEKLPPSIVNILEKGIEGNIEENPNSTDIIFKNVNNVLVGSVKLAIQQSIFNVQKYGLKSIVFDSRVTGEAIDFGRELYSKIEDHLKTLNGEKDSKKGMCLIGAGELTVTIKGTGIGGRNQEMLLSFLDTIKNKDLKYKFLIIGANLDGIEGNSKAMGALVDNYILRQIVEKKLDTRSYLENNDSNSFFKDVQGEIITGPTGTNVNDLVIILIEKNLQS